MFRNIILKITNVLLVAAPMTVAYGENGLSDAGTSTVINTPLNVRKHPAAVLTDADSARIIGDANGYLSQCRVTLSQVGNVLDSTGLPSVINSQADMNMACASTKVKSEGPSTLGTVRRYRIVNAINWCGGPASGGTILGCTPTPGTCVVVRRWLSLEGQVLAHEFGHSKSLPHRSDANAVMYPSVGASNTAFDLSECNTLRQLSIVKMGPVKPLQEVPQAQSIEDFVSRIYVDGLPYDGAVRFSSSDVAKISPWMKDESKAALWGNVATTVGIVADQSAEALLSELILRSATGTLPFEQYDGRVAAIMSLGYVVKNNGSATARRFLETHMDPVAWARLQWMAPYQRSAAERNNDLAAAAALGLGRAGDAAAVRYLNSTLKKFEAAKTTNAPALRRAIRQAISDAEIAKSLNKPGR